jgi:dihydrofolate reductase
MTVSLDGFVEDLDGSADALYPDLAVLQDTPYMKAMQDETGAVLMGWRSFEMAGDPDSYADTYELQVPIFVVTHTPPAVAPKRNERLFFTFVTDGVQTAVARAVEAAGERAVTGVGGAALTRQLLAAAWSTSCASTSCPSSSAPACGCSRGPAPLLWRSWAPTRWARTSLRFRVASVGRALAVVTS